MDTKTVVQGGYGPVPMEENSRRYIDAEPVVIPMTGYYLRRMMSGELIEYVASVAASAPVVVNTPSAALAPAIGGAGSGGGEIVEMQTAPAFDLSETEGA